MNLAEQLSPIADDMTGKSSAPKDWIATKEICATEEYPPDGKTISMRLDHRRLSTVAGAVRHD
ncbi:MAG: hypothetical protein NTX56_10460 [Proteobacteria bacterium]|nr:hypothetical protein [Pseudomonadota bacterium]